MKLAYKTLVWAWQVYLQEYLVSPASASLGGGEKVKVGETTCVAESAILVAPSYKGYV